MASMVRLDAATILCSNPNNLLVKGKEGMPGRYRDRRNVTVRLSRDGGRTWPVDRVIEPGPSGYSDLAVGPKGNIYCFYERGGISGNHYHTQSLTLVTFSRHFARSDSNTR